MPWLLNGWLFWRRSSCGDQIELFERKHQPQGHLLQRRAKCPSCKQLQSTHLQIQLQKKPDATFQNVYWHYLGLCQIQSRCQQDSVMTNHVLGPKINRVDFACETLSFEEHYLLNSSSILSSCSGVNIVRTLLFFILRPPSGRMSSENEFKVYFYAGCWVCV